MSEPTRKIIVVDFSGTLIKPFVAEEANKKRFSILGISETSPEEEKNAHATKSHYALLKEFVEKTFGVTDEMSIVSLNDRGEEVTLSGKEVKTKIMTDLFRNCMYGVAGRNGLNIFTDGMLEVLSALQQKDYVLAIVSGVRKDIITGMFAITDAPQIFDYIYGQDSILSKDNNEVLLEELSKQGTIAYVIGDKIDDLEPAKQLGAKTIFLKGGHPQGGEEEFADYTIEFADELEKIIQ